MRTVALAIIVLALIWPIRALLVRARWTALAPRAAVALWQAIGLTIAVALIGACYEVAAVSAPGSNPRRRVSDFTAAAVVVRPARALTPNQLFALTAGLIAGVLLIGAIAVRVGGDWQRRARLRMLVQLVGSELPEVPGALVLEHSSVAAYAVPGRHPQVVVSSAAVAALSQEELGAVLAHERAHLRAHHHLVLLPLRILGALLPYSRSLAAVEDNVRGLLEMAADDRTVHESGSHALAHALCRMAVTDSASDGATATSDVTTRRVERALVSRRRSRLFVFGSSLSAAGIAVLPFVALFSGFGGR